MSGILCAILSPSSQREHSEAGKGLKKGNVKDKQEHVIASAQMKAEQAETFSLEKRWCSRIEWRS